MRLGRSEKHAGDQTSPSGATPETLTDSRLVYPCTIHHNGRLGGLYTVFAESAQARTEWKAKLEEAIGLRKVVQESNKVFEIETLSADTFMVPAIVPGSGTQAWSHENPYTGKVTCSVPFSKYGCVGDIHIGLTTQFSSQLPQMAGVLSLSDVRKVSGLASVTIRDVRIPREI